jgi:hypothetical protein
MIQEKSNKLGVIFIDCWHQYWQWQNTGGADPNFYINMLETLSHYDVDSYVFHTSFLNLNYVTQDVITYFKEFVVEQPQDSLKKQGVVDLLEATGTERLSNELHVLAENSKSIFIPTFGGFDQWRQTSDIAQWIVVGCHWPICTHTKPLGFENLKNYKQQLPHLRFYSIPSCTAKWVYSEAEQLATTLTDQDYQDDTSMNWTKIHPNLYELVL